MESGESIAYARVSLTPDSTAVDSAAAPAPLSRTAGSAGRTLTNPSGYYAIPGVSAGRYTLEIRAVGFRDHRESIVLGEGETRRDATLEPAPFPVPTVDVAGTRSRPREEQTLTGYVELPAKQLARLPAVGEQDIIRSLQLLPGIQSASDVSTGLYIRGGGPDQTLILLDQIPLYNPTHAFGFFSTFNPGAIKDMLLYKGAYPAPYGGRLGAVLDVSNRDGNRNQFHGQGGVSVIAGRLTVEGPIQNGSWVLSARRTYLDPILNAVRSDSNEVPSYYFYDVNGRVNRSLSSRDNVMISGYGGKDDVHLDLDIGSYVDIRWGNSAGTAKWTHLFGPGLFGNFLVAASEYRSDTEVRIFDTPYRVSNRLLDVSVKGDLNWRPGRGHEINAGLLASRYHFEYDQEFNGVPQPGLDQTPAAVSVYAEDDWDLSALTAVRAGLRLERFGKRGRFGLEPRVSVSRILSDRFRLKAGGGGYTQHLQLVSTEAFSGADFWVPTDVTAKAGRSWQAVCGVEWEPSTRHSVSLEGYATSLRNLVQLDNLRSPDASGTSTEDLFFTGGRGWAAGVELFAQRKTGSLTGWIGYGLGWSRRRFSEVNRGETYPPKYDRRHDLKLVADWKRRKWSYGAAFLFGTGQAFTPAAARYTLINPANGGTPDDGLLLPGAKNSARLLPYHRLDVSATRHGSLFGMKADYFLQVFNLYSRKNEWFIQYDTDDPETVPKVVHQLPIVPTIGVNFEF